MAKSWSEVESSDSYKALPEREKVKAKKEYWGNVVTQKQDFKMMDSVSQKQAKYEFFGGNLIEDLPDETFKSPNIALMTIGDTFKVLNKSSLGVISGAIQPILHPINTAKAFGLVAKGAIEKIIPGKQIDEKYADAIGEFYKKRYGSIDALADTIATDPYGYIADVAGIVSGGYGLTRVGMRVAGVKTALDPIKSEAIKTGTSIKQSLPKIDLSKETKIFNDYNDVFPSTKKTIGDLKSAKEDVITAVKAIDENIPEEGIVHPLTGDVFIGKPKNRYEALLAHDNAKKKIWEKASSLSEGATEQGAKIDLPKLVDEAVKESITNFGKVAETTTKRTISNDILKEASLIKTQKQITPKQSEEFMKTLYEDSQRLMQSGNFAEYSKKDFYKSLYGKLRVATDDAIEASLGKSGYLHYRKQYAAVRKAEDAIKSGANKWLKHNQRGVVGSLADFWSIEELLSGNIAKSATVKATSEVIKYWKNPDRKVFSIFNNASKLKTKEPTQILKPEVVDKIMRIP